MQGGECVSERGSCCAKNLRPTLSMVGVRGRWHKSAPPRPLRLYCQCGGASAACRPASRPEKLASPTDMPLL